MHRVDSQNHLSQIKLGHVFRQTIFKLTEQSQQIAPYIIVHHQVLLRELKKTYLEKLKNKNIKLWIITDSQKVCSWINPISINHGILLSINLLIILFHSLTLPLMTIIIHNRVVLFPITLYKAQLNTVYSQLWATFPLNSISSDGWSSHSLPLNNLSMTKDYKTRGFRCFITHCALGTSATCNYEPIHPKRCHNSSQRERTHQVVIILKSKV